VDLPVLLDPLALLAPSDPPDPVVQFHPRRLHQMEAVLPTAAQRVQTVGLSQ
jgi:hypothetical protein